MLLSRTSPLRSRAMLAAAACAGALAAAGCSQDAPVEVPGEEVRGGAVGPDVEVSEDVELLQVQLEYPLDGVYEVGEDARMFFAISNTGTVPATLVDVSGPDFTGVEVSGAGDGEDVAIVVQPNNNAYIGAEGQPVVTLLGLEEELRSSESIPVTFAFERAGEVTVEVMVSAEGQNPLPTYDFPNPAEDPSGDSTG